MGDQRVAMSLPTHRTTQTQNIHTQTFMSRVGYEPAIPVFDWTKTVHALDCEATLIGVVNDLEDLNVIIYLISCSCLRKLAESLLKWPQSVICPSTYRENR
jgi:hypothetical protein